MMKTYDEMIKEINDNYAEQNKKITNKPTIDGLKELSDYLKKNFPKKDEGTIVEEVDKAKGK